MGEGLTPKQRRFVEEYLKDLNATQAAIRAGYSGRAAEVQGCRLLSNAKVARAVQAAMKERSEKAGVDAQWVLDNLVELVGRCMQKEPVMAFDYVEKEMRQVEDEEGRGVWSFDSKGANRALELIGKHLGMFKEKVEVGGEEGGPLRVIFNIPRPPKD